MASQLKDIENVQAVKGNHFQFKSEKEWRSSGQPVNSRFALNMKTLAEDLSTIPFYERQNLPIDLIPEQELLKMERNVTKLKVKNCSAQPNETEPVIPTPTELSPGDRICSILKSSLYSSSITQHDDEVANESVKCEDSSLKKSDDLEDWLDSVLDD